FFFQAEDGIRDFHVTGVQTCALPILGLLVYLFISIKNRGIVFRLLEKKAPEFADTLNVLRVYPIKRDEVVKVLLLSCVIEIIGRSEERRVGKECRSGWWQEN